MKTRLSYFLSLIVIGALLSCTSRDRLTSSTVIQVNEQKMNAQEFAARLARGLKNLDAFAAKDPANVSRIKDEITRSFIVNCISAEYAKANDLSLSEDDVDTEINLTRSSYPDDLSFKKELSEEGLSLNEWRTEVRNSLVSQRVFKKIAEKIPKPSESEVTHFYEANKDRFRRKERIYLRQIVVDDLTKAALVREEINKKKDFAELAGKYSVAPEAKQGGAVGWVEKGSLDVFDKAFALPIGGVSQILESSYGYHIFKTERKAAAGIAALTEVRVQIGEELLAQKEQVEFMGWLDRQLKNVRVLKNKELLDSLHVETKGQTL